MIRDTRYGIRDPGCGSNHGRFDPDKATGWRRFNRGYGVCDVLFAMWDTRYRMPDMGYEIRDARYGIFDVG